MRLPTASSPGQNSFAIDSLTSTTSGDPARSASVNARPLSSGMRIVRRYSGVMSW
jgi:hypothetical protein